MFIEKRKYKSKSDAENRDDRVIELDNIDSILIRAKRHQKCREKTRIHFSNNSMRKQLHFILFVKRLPQYSEG